jgi:Putative prokaryotic signal transducing protein
MDDTVVVKIVSGEPEAQLVCGLLRSAGIECGFRDTDAVDSQLEEFIASGPREIIVHRADLEAARALVGEDAG